jgi:plastocyanin
MTLVQTGLLALALAGGAGASAASPPTTNAAIVHVDIRSFAFVPATVSVHVGDTVEWTNHDFAPHTATSKTGAWRTPTLNNGASGRWTATAPGTFAYRCEFHTNMKGTIIVAAPPISGPHREKRP